MRRKANRRRVNADGSCRLWSSFSLRNVRLEMISKALVIGLMTYAFNVYNSIES